MTEQVVEKRIWTKERMITLLETSDKALARAVLAIYAHQTATEQAVGNTKEDNGVGFNGVDAPFLSSIAEKLPHYDMRMTPRQTAKVRPMMKKYAGQLLAIAQQKGATVEAKEIPKRAVQPAYAGAF